MKKYSRTLCRLRDMRVSPKRIPIKIRKNMVSKSPKLKETNEYGKK